MLGWAATVFLVIGLGIKLAISSRWLFAIILALSLLGWWTQFDVRLVCLGLFIAAPILTRVSNQQTARFSFLLCALSSTLGSLLISFFSLPSV